MLRFLACLGIGGVWPNAVALVAEAWPDASRPFLAGLLGAAANVGFVLLGVIGYCFPDHRRRVAVGAARRGVARPCSGSSSCSPCRSRRAGSRAGGGAGRRRTSPLREVLRPPLLSRTILGIALGAIPVVGSAANANWLVPWTDHAHAAAGQRVGRQRAKPADPRSKAKTQITRSGGAVFGSLLGGVIASLLGRRLSYFLISLGALAVSTYIFSQLDPLHPQFQLFTFLLGFVGITYFGWLPLFLPGAVPDPGALDRHRASRSTPGGSSRRRSCCRPGSCSTSSAATTRRSASGAG